VREGTRLGVLVLACIAAAWPLTAPADEKKEDKAEDKKREEGKKGDAKDEKPEWETAPAEHRGDFAIGLSAMPGLGASNGFPNDSKKIGRERYYTESGLGFAPSSSIWIGGAFADWLTFGLGGGYGTILTGDTLSPAPYAFFHGDVYPLYALGGHCRNLGGMFETGIAFPRTVDAETEETLIDSAGASYIFAGAFWEGIEVWKIKMGPLAGVHYMFSQTIRRPVAVLGFRISLYSAP
jgi:hypothetical protein